MIDPHVIKGWKAGIASELAEAERELAEAHRALADARIALAEAESDHQAAAEFLSEARQPIPAALSRVIHPVIAAVNSAQGNVAREKQRVSSVGYVIGDLRDALAELERLAPTPEPETEAELEMTE